MAIKPGRSAPIAPEEKLAQSQGAAEDAALVARIWAGEAAAFDRLVVTYFNPMARYAAAVLGAPDAAEDVAQDVLMRIWRGRSAWTVNTSLKSYLLTAVRHEALNRLRQERGRARVHDAFAVVDVREAPDGADAMALRADLAAAVNALPARRREAVLLRYVEGMSFPQVAEVLGISTKAAEQGVGLGRSYLDRGRFDSAAAAVANVPTEFVYNLAGSSNNLSALQPLYWYEEYMNSSNPWFGPVIANDEGHTTYNFATSNDARLALVSLGYTNDGSTNTFTAGLHLLDSLFYWPLRFGSNPMALGAFPLATGMEARLIGIEDSLHGNAGAVVPALNALRSEAPSTFVQAATAVPALSADSTSCGGANDTMCVKVLFRERAFWLFGSGIRLGDMRREERQYNLPDASVFPTGPYWYDPADSTLTGGNYQPPWPYYGKDVSMTLPTVVSGSKTLNPNYTGGCLAGTSTQTP